MSHDRAAAQYSDAAAEALRCWPLEINTIELVTVSENVTYRVHAGSTSYVLRLHRPGYHNLVELNSERIWIRALAAAGLDVPQPVLAADGSEYVTVTVPATGEERFVGLGHWVEGEPLAERMETAGHVDVRDFAQLGELMAAIHNQSSTWTPPQHFRRHSFDRDGFTGEKPFWGRFWNVAELVPAERRLLSHTREQIRTTLAGLPKDPATYSLIHADLHAGNVLVRPGGLHIIDFDDAGFGWHVYDLAVALFGHHLGDQAPALERAMVEGYRRQRALADETVALLPTFLLIRELALLGWMDQRPEHKDPARFRAHIESLCHHCEAFLPP